VPSAAVIPAPVAYTNIAAVKKLVVDRGAGAPGRRAGLGGCRAHAARIPRTRRARLTGGTAAAGGGLPLLRPPDGSPCPRSPQAEPILPCVVRTAGGTRAARAAASPRPPAVPSWATPARSARPAPSLAGGAQGRVHSRGASVAVTVNKTACPKWPTRRRHGRAWYDKGSTAGPRPSRVFYRCFRPTRAMRGDQARAAADPTLSGTPHATSVTERKRGELLRPCVLRRERWNS